MLLRISNRARSQCKSSVFISNNFTLFRTIDFDKHSIAIPNAIGEIQFHQSGRRGKNFCRNEINRISAKWRFFRYAYEYSRVSNTSWKAYLNMGYCIVPYLNSIVSLEGTYTCKKINGGNLIYIRIYRICTCTGIIKYSYFWIIIF